MGPTHGYDRQAEQVEPGSGPATRVEHRVEIATKGQNSLETVMLSQSSAESVSFQLTIHNQLRRSRGYH